MTTARTICGAVAGFAVAVFGIMPALACPYSNNRPKCGVYVTSDVRTDDARRCYEKGRCDGLTVKTDGLGGDHAAPQARRLIPADVDF